MDSWQGASGGKGMALSEDPCTLHTHTKYILPFLDTAPLRILTVDIRVCKVQR
jgi:hypothetical protein